MDLVKFIYARLDGGPAVNPLRVILSHHDTQHDCGDPDSWAHPYVGCWDVRALASIWRDHPDYDPAWNKDE